MNKKESEKDDLGNTLKAMLTHNKVLRSYAAFLSLVHNGFVLIIGFTFQKPELVPTLTKENGFHSFHSGQTKWH